jgi:hypothetical protein
MGRAWAHQPESQAYPYLPAGVQGFTVLHALVSDSRISCADMMFTDGHHFEHHLMFDCQATAGVRQRYVGLQATYGT